MSIIVSENVKVDKKYNLIFSIGEACLCTQALRNSKLQIYSYPFDWLFGGDFISRCEILANKFERFIEKSDLEWAFSVRSISCEAYHNKHNDLTFNHDFNKEVPFDKMYDIVKEKYNRRISRLFQNIEKANKILIVYTEAPIKNHPKIDDEVIIQGYDIIKKAINKDIDLLYIHNAKEKEFNQINLSENIIKLTFDYKDYNAKEDYAPDMKKLNAVFQDYKLKLPLTYIIKKKIIKFFVCLIPFKEKRAKLRKKYHV